LWRSLDRASNGLSVSPLLIRGSLSSEFSAVIGNDGKALFMRCPLIGRSLLPRRLWFGKYSSLFHWIETETLLARVIANRRFDVIHMPDQTLPPRGKFGKVVTVHDLVTETGPKTKFQRFYLRRVLGRADRLVCVSSTTAADIKRFAPDIANKISVNPAGLDLNLFRPGPSQPEWLASRFQLSSRYFLHVGVCSERKNPNGILEAARVVKRRYGAEFLIVFVGPYQVNQAALDYLRFRGQELGIIDQLRFLGDVTTDDLVVLYRSSSALLFPSLFEGFGYPPVEALACGTPCIVSNEGAVAEVVGEIGLAVNPRNIDEIATAMVAVLRGEVSDVNYTGPALAARFSASLMGDYFARLYSAFGAGN
jgi:glycosyltransferase involved in cell wall biosynthesis